MQVCFSSPKYFNASFGSNKSSPIMFMVKIKKVLIGISILNLKFSASHCSSANWKANGKFEWNFILSSVESFIFSWVEKAYNLNWKTWTAIRFSSRKFSRTSAGKCWFNYKTQLQTRLDNCSLTYESIYVLKQIQNEK